MKLLPLIDIEHEECKDMTYEQIKKMVRTRSCKVFMKEEIRSLNQRMEEQYAFNEGRSVVSFFFYYYLASFFVGLALWVAYVKLIKHLFSFAM